MTELFRNNMIHCELADGLAYITIDNLPMNPLSNDVLVGLNSILNILDKEESLRVVIITGAGDKAFVAGADIKEFPNWDPDISETMTSRGQRLFSRIENFYRPIIAAVNGYALGGGLELALACDIRLASDNAKMGLPEVTLGIIPGYGGTQRLCRTINAGEAKKMVYTGAMIDAQRAYEIGLVQIVTTQDELMNEAVKLAKKIAKNGPIAISLCKNAINCERNASIEQGIKVELAAARTAFGTEDHTEGIDAFINKRKAEFKNK